LLGFALADFAAVRASPRMFKTALGMFALVGWGVLEWLNVAPTHSGIGHAAHLYGIVFGLAVGLALRFAARRNPRESER